VREIHPGSQLRGSANLNKSTARIGKPTREFADMNSPQLEPVSGQEKQSLRVAVQDLDLKGAYSVIEKNRFDNWHRVRI
jgi:hypothetical protein